MSTFCARMCQSFVHSMDTQRFQKGYFEDNFVRCLHFVQNNIYRLDGEERDPCLDFKHCYYLLSLDSFVWNWKACKCLENCLVFRNSKTAGNCIIFGYLFRFVCHAKLTRLCLLYLLSFLFIPYRDLLTIWKKRACYIR